MRRFAELSPCHLRPRGHTPTEDDFDASASPGEIRVSGTVKDLVTGSGRRFLDRGKHHLKSVDGEWQLYELA